MRSIALLVLASVAVPLAATGQPAPSTGATGPRTVSSVPAAPADTTTRFHIDIPAQPLGDALGVFSHQTGIRVETGAPLDERVRSHDVAGTLTAAEALRVMLEGTGYGARFGDAETVLVARVEARDSTVPTLDPVVVTGTAGRHAGYAAVRTTSATKTDVPLRDVPQAITVIGQRLLADQSMQSMADVVRYVPGITMGQGEGHRDAPTIRGIGSTADFFVDGVRDDAQYLRDLYNAERVEALKGSNAMIFGRGGGGGVINRVTKEAQWTTTRELSLEGGSFAHRRATLDVGDAAGRMLAVRLNGMYEDSRGFRDATDVERQGINPTATLLARGTLVRVGYEYFADRRVVDRGIPSFQGGPSDADIETFFGDPDASHARAIVHSAGATIERGSPDGLMLRNRTRFIVYDKFYQNVLPGAVSADGSEVTLSAYSNATDRRNLFNQTDVTYALGGGAVRQLLLVGAELGRQATEHFRQTGYFPGDATTLVVPFDEPTVSAGASFRQSATDADNHSTADVAAVYVQDQVRLGDHWQAIAGVRYDRFAIDFHDDRSGQTLRRDDDMISPRAGLVFKPGEPLSLYGTYSIAHLPSSGDQFASLTATTRALEPERFVNREIGIKWEPRPALALTAALYRLDQSKTTAPDPGDPTRVVQTGRQRTTGVELGLAGRLTDAWQIVGGYASQRATIVSRTAAAASGATVPLVPHRTLSLWNRYDATGRIGAGLGIIHQARMYAAIDNTVTLPSFTRIDGAIYLTLTDFLRAQLNVENILDERYYATSHGNNNILPGAPRSLRISVTATP